MLRLLLVSLSLSMAAPVLAAKDPPKRPEIFEKLVSCRAILDSAQRLACYDAQVERLDAAEKSSEVVVLDKAEVKKTRRGLFGFTIPDLGIFSGRDDGDGSDEITEIESTIREATMNRAGKWTFVIEDGARWVQMEASMIRTPKPGMTIRIKKGALGSYFASINDRPGIRVRREN